MGGALLQRLVRLISGTSRHTATRDAGTERAQVAAMEAAWVTAAVSLRTQARAGLVLGC
jgi:hypothetical protein